MSGFFLRDGAWPSNGREWYKDTDRFLLPFLSAKSVKDLFLAMEKYGSVGRLQPEGAFPEVCKGATIDTEELQKLRSIKDVVRLGRVTSIGPDSMILERGSVPIAANETLFVDCMAENFYGYASNIHEKFTIFEPGRVNLGPSPLVFNPSCSSSLFAYLEANFSDDAIKNEVIYFLKGKKHTETTPKLLLGSFLAQLKTLQALGKYGPAVQFVLQSRTNQDAPSPD
mmetsp:Transcript_22373/g.32902  ORF Transcript_22373/g.32902 Transcript_22373/m.32902 type:complete len:226 (-) Transcript_22373:152-829(-)